MKNCFFITGTDTGVGKTYITRLFLKNLQKQGKQTVALKPVASGIDSQLGGNEDAYWLMQEASVKSALQEVNPYCFKMPIAPSIAATIENKPLNIEEIWNACQPLLAKPSDVVLVEGVGGWNVPLNDQETTVDLAKRFNFPVILVVGLRLGCLNHALLTAQAILKTGLPLAGWIANQVDPEMPYMMENVETLKRLLPEPYLGFVGFSKNDEHTFPYSILI